MMVSPHKPISHFYLILTGLLAIGFFIGLIIENSKVEIIVCPQPIAKEINFQAKISKIPGQGLFGDIFQKQGSAKNTFSVLGQKEIEDFARGRVTIFNNRPTSQNLVKNTRLLSDNGLLFRIQKSVFIPAKSQAEIEIKADQKGAKYNLGPTAFTIPGLALWLQKEVFAQSNSEIIGGISYVKTVSQEDFEKAHQNLKEIILKQTLEEIEVNKKPFEKIAVSQEILKEISSAKIGDEIDEFEMEIFLKIDGVIFRQEELGWLAQDKLKKELEPGFSLYQAKSENLKVEILEIDQEKSLANLDILFKANIIINETNQILKKENFFGLKKDEISTYLSSFKEIESFRLKFPFFIKRGPENEKNLKILIDINRY